RHYPNGMPKFSEISNPIVRGSTGFHPDNGWRDIGKGRKDFRPSYCFMDQYLALLIFSVDTERMFG
ncbi:hypothetical protein, partial [Photobacterium ganghwense]|uniref:hypothetical protein n=1 Tax=Photobacterium ganghwense TaxID=320778 RepID=UPI001C2D215E